MSSTLLALYLGRDLVGRCDINCYDGSDARCECVCSGLNHGIGLDAAADQTRRMVEEWIEANRARGIIFDGVEYGIAVMHEPLFALPGAPDQRRPGQEPGGVEALAS